MAQINFPGGQVVDVVFDEKAHTYVVAYQLADGSFSDYRPTHGITAPLAVVPKPFLTPWGARLGVDALIEQFYNHPELVDSLPEFYDDKKAMDENQRTEDNKPVMSSYRFKKKYPWYGAAKGAYKDASTVGKELGTWLHKSIEDYLRSDRKQLPIVTPEVQGMWDSFMMFDNFFKPKYENLEFVVYSLIFGYSGQGDFKGWMSGRHCIGDWKSTNRSDMNPDGISVEYFFQVGGLAQAEYERTGVWVDDLFIANLDKNGGEPRVIWASQFGMAPQDCARAYISCLNNYHTIKDWDYKFARK
jgi:hypothetical protein